MCLPSRRLTQWRLRLQAPLILFLVAIHLMVGIIAALLSFGWAPRGFCDWLVRAWSRVLLRLFGVRLEVAWAAETSVPNQSGRGVMYLSNHVSWIDVFVLAAAVPLRFVAKSEVRQWPLAGWLAQAVGTVFIERGRRHAVMHVNHELVRRLKQGQQIGIFPEGTTTDGSVLLRFHSNLVHAAVAAGVDVVPVALCYLQNNRPSVVPAYIGEMTLAQSVWQMLLAPGLGAKVSFLQPMATVEATRQDLADHAYQAIAQTLGVDQSRLPGDLA